MNNDRNLICFRFYVNMKVPYYVGLALTIPLFVAVLIYMQYKDHECQIYPHGNGRSIDDEQEYYSCVDGHLVYFVIPLAWGVSILLAAEILGRCFHSPGYDDDVLTCIVLDNSYKLTSCHINKIFKGSTLEIRTPLFCTKDKYEIQYLAKIAGANKILDAIDAILNDPLSPFFEALYYLHVQVRLAHAVKDARQHGIPLELIERILNFLTIKDIKLPVLANIASKHPIHAIVNSYYQNGTAILGAYNNYVHKIHNDPHYDIESQQDLRSPLLPRVK